MVQAPQEARTAPHGNREDRAIFHRNRELLMPNIAMTLAQQASNRLEQFCSKNPGINQRFGEALADQWKALSPNERRLFHNDFERYATAKLGMEEGQHDAFARFLDKNPALAGLIGRDVVAEWNSAPSQARQIFNNNFEQFIHAKLKAKS